MAEKTGSIRGDPTVIRAVMDSRNLPKDFPGLYREIESSSRILMLWTRIWDAVSELDRGLMWITLGVPSGGMFATDGQYVEYNHMVLLLLLCDEAQYIRDEEQDLVIQGIERAHWNIAATLRVQDVGSLAKSLSTKKVRSPELLKKYAQRAICLGSKGHLLDQSLRFEMAHDTIG
jgi:hypothetical protein